ncbi:hypothetical protein V490_07569 [Pseudogymnoascus sp. VKM F-3557]|nr:hypothetical protein V490_07569 [Pseudogymnoascus sp. VKM F-3557]
MTLESVLNADLPGTMDIKEAKSKLQTKKEACWAHLTDPKEKRRVQNKINQRSSRWEKLHRLETLTLDDYHELEHAIQGKGRQKKRKGRLRRPDDRPKRTSQRLADKRRKPDANNLEEDSLIDPALFSGFDQVDNAPLSEGGVNISTETTTSHPSITSDSHEFPHSLPVDIDPAPDGILNCPFDSYNSQTLTQDFNMADDEMNDPSFSTTLQPETNTTGDGWDEPIQHDVLDKNSIEWQGNFASLNESHDLLGNNFMVPPVSHGPFIRPVIHDLLKSAGGGIDGGVEMLSPVASLLSKKVDNGSHQAEQLHEAKVHTLVSDLMSQLHGRGEDKIQEMPVLRRRSLAERDDLAPLVQHLLLTLKQQLTHMSETKVDGTGRKENEPAKRYGAELEGRVVCLWNALSVEARRFPSSAT